MAPRVVESTIPGWATVEAAAQRLAVSPNTIWRRAAAGRLTRYRLLGRTVFSIDELDALQTELNR